MRLEKGYVEASPTPTYPPTHARTQTGAEVDMKEAFLDIMKGADKRELERKRGKKPVKDEPPKSPEPKVAGFPAANRQIVSKAQQTNCSH